MSIAQSHPEAAGERLSAGSVVTRAAVLARPGGVPLQYSRITRPWPDPEMIVLEPPGGPLCFVVTFPELVSESNLWRDGEHLVRQPCPPGSFSVYDFSHKWIAQVPNPLDSFHLWLPKVAFKELEQAHRISIVDNIHLDQTRHCRDEVMMHLAASLMPSLSSPNEVNRLFADHVFEAMRLHIAQTYGGLPPHPPPRRGALTPLQERRAKERILDDLANDPSLAELALLCGLSVSHFARAFKQGTGAPPHRWLIKKRVERAQKLLASSDAPISEIAQTCGFADQSHLTRVFTRAMGVSPGVWRRERRR
jgi:AraC-like DNA-binding protein